MSEEAASGGSRAGRARSAALLLAGWLLVSLLTAGQVYLGRHLADLSPLGFGYLYLIHLIDWFPWLLLTPIVFRLARAYPLGRRSWRHALVVHVPVSLAVGVLELLLDNTVAFLLEGPPPPGVTFASNFLVFLVHGLHTQILAYWLILSAAHALAFYRSYRERAAEAARLEVEKQGLVDALLETDRDSPGFAEQLTIRSAGRTKVVGVHEIDWIRAADYYVELHVGAETYLLRESMSRLESRLDPDRFARIHRSAIVNVRRVRRLDRVARGYEVVLENGTRLRLSRSRRRALQAVLDGTGHGPVAPRVAD